MIVEGSVSLNTMDKIIGPTKKNASIRGNNNNKMLDLLVGSRDGGLEQFGDVLLCHDSTKIERYGLGGVKIENEFNLFNNSLLMQ